MDARVVFARGRELLDPVLAAHGFAFDEAKAAARSSASVARGAYVRDDRRLELGYRNGLLDVVVYQVGDRVLTHDAYMHAVLGPVGSNMFPAMAGDPLDGFRYLAHDLRNYAHAFLTGPASHFVLIADRAAAVAETDGKTTLYRR